MKREEFAAGVMKYHDQDSHAPDGIELRDFLAHSSIGRANQDHPRARPSRSSEAACCQRSGTNPGECNKPRRHSLLKSDFLQIEAITGAALFQFSSIAANCPEGRIRPRDPQDCPFVTGRDFYANWPKDMIVVEHLVPFNIRVDCPSLFAEHQSVQRHLTLEPSWTRATNP